jgi:hypothetical protein
VAGKIIADIIEAPYDSIRMNVANVTVLTANSSGLTYVPTGNVNINIGNTANITVGTLTANGIKFPATAVASADANTLDDYEEGTWTPTVRGSSTAGTYTPSTVVGTYTKVGRLVTLQFRIVGFSTASGGVGYLQITGAPFTNAEAYTGTIRFDYLDLNASTVQVILEFIGSSSTSTLYLYESYDNTVGRDTPIASVSTSTILIGSITFSAQ